MTQDGFDPRSKLNPMISGSFLLEDDHILSIRARAFVPNQTLWGRGLENYIFNKFPESSYCVARLKTFNRKN